MSKVRIARHDGTVTVTFDRPEVKNALDAECWTLLDGALREVEDNPDDRVLVLTGAGNEFTSGADLSGGITSAPDVVLAKMREISDIIIRLHQLPKPTIAKVDGVAVGVGMSLALGCDLVVATDRSRFGAVFTKQGLSPDGGLSWLLPRLIGPARAKELTLLGRLVPGPEALALGLVNRLVPGDELDALVGEWARQLGELSPTALAETKRLVDASWESTFIEALEQEALSQQRSTAARRAVVQQR